MGCKVRQLSLAVASVIVQPKNYICITHQHWLWDVSDLTLPWLVLKESLFIGNFFKQHQIFGLELGDVAPLGTGQVDGIMDHELPPLLGNEDHCIQNVVNSIIREEPWKAQSGES